MYSRAFLRFVLRFRAAINVQIEQGRQQVEDTYWTLGALGALCAGLAPQLGREGVAGVAAVVSLLGVEARNQVDGATRRGWLRWQRADVGGLSDDWADLLALEAAEALCEELIAVASTLMDSRDCTPPGWEADLLDSAGKILRLAGQLRRELDRVAGVQ